MGAADFEEASCLWEPAGGVFTLNTSRPAGAAAKPAGLLRKGGPEWRRCRLVFRAVSGISIRHDYDTKPSEAGLIEVRQEGPGFRVRLSSSRGLVVELALNRLDGSLEDA